MMSAKTTRAVAFLLACAMLLTLCTSCEKNDRKKFVMRVMSVLDSESDFDAYSDILTEYTKAHKNVTINDTSTDHSNSYKMELTLSSTYKGSGTPDVIYCSVMPDMSEICDYFVTIDDIRKDYPDFAATVSETVLKSTAASDGKSYCIPVRGEWSGIVVNAALFRQSGLNVPETWKDIVKAAYHFKESETYLFANSLEDCSALLEYTVRSIGGSNSLDSAINGDPDQAWEDALNTLIKLDELGSFPPMNVGAFDTLISSSDLKHTTASDERNESAVELYNSGKAAILLIDNTICRRIDNDLDSQYIMLPNVDTSADAFETTTTSFTTTTTIPTSFGAATKSTIRNTLPITEPSQKHNSGGTVSEQASVSTTTSPPSGTSPNTSPTNATRYNDASSNDIDPGKPENGLYVNYSEGFYITKKAYYNEDKRADILEFVEFFLQEQNCIRLCTVNQVPSLSKLSSDTMSALADKSNIYRAVVNSVQSADRFVITTQTESNKFFWNHCQMAVAYMSKGVLTKEKALKMISDTQITVADAYAS